MVRGAQSRAGMERAPRKLSLPSAALRGRWDAAYMRAAQPSTLVDVSVMRDDDDGYLRGTAETHETIAMQFAEQFLAQLDDVEGASSWRRRPSALRYHLAQCPLELVPALQADAQELLGAACAAACSSLGRTTQPLQTNLWFAIGATTSGLHYDAFDNLLLLLRGRKRVLLLPPSASADLAPRPAHGASANHSQLGAAELASLAASAPTPPLTLELLPGEALFIPEGWWHQVESPEEVTLGLNWWWDGPSAALLPTAAATAAAAAAAVTTAAIATATTTAADDDDAAQDGAAAAGGGAAHPPPTAAAYVLRRAFHACVREEEQRLVAALLAAGGEGPEGDGPGGDEPKGEPHGDGGNLVGNLVGDLDPAAGGLLRAAAAGHAQLLRCLASSGAGEVLGGLRGAAHASPRALRRLLCGLTPSAAHLLCAHLDTALQGSPGQSDAASLAAAQLDEVFSACGDEAVVKQSLALQAAAFADAAAAGVLQHVLGLTAAPPPPTTTTTTTTAAAAAAAAATTTSAALPVPASSEAAETGPCVRLEPVAGSKRRARGAGAGRSTTRRVGGPPIEVENALTD